MRLENGIMLPERGRDRTKGEGMRCLMFVAVFALCLTTVAEEENIRVFKDLASAKKELFAGKDVKSGWISHAAARGGDTYFINETRWYDMEGEQIDHSSTVNSSKHSGTVAAVPIGDFEVKHTFAYTGKNREGTSAVLTGKVVSVTVQISTGGVKSPAEHVIQRSVENMVKSGVPLPPATGGKPGRLVSLLTAAKKRFGARIAKPCYDARAGKVEIFLQDCSDGDADSSYLPATREGLSLAQRLAIAKKLEKTADKGSVSVFSIETEVIPVGSKRVPFNGNY